LEELRKLLDRDRAFCYNTRAFDNLQEVNRGMLYAKLQQRVFTVRSGSDPAAIRWRSAPVHR